MTLTREDWQAILLTLQLATVTTVVLLTIATPLAWWLAHARTRGAALASALVALPLVLPASVIGFYLLVAFGPQGWGGQATQWLGWGLLPFTFPGLVLASVIYSLPFAVQPLRHAFEAMGTRPMEVAATLRANRLDAFVHVALPMARSGFLSAAIMSFAHTVGEFGVVLMIGGNIPEQTRVISTQIFGHVEALEYAQAHALSAVMVVFSMTVLFGLALLDRRVTRVSA